MFERTNAALRKIGIDQNESVGTAKVLHILAPTYFPLVDSPIAERMGLKEQNVSLSPESYMNWMRRLERLLKAHSTAAQRMQKKLNRPILKLIDEGLYVMCTKYGELPEMAQELGI